MPSLTEVIRGKVVVESHGPSDEIGELSRYVRLGSVAEREVQMWLVNHPGEAPTLEMIGSTAHCPEGGEYRLEGVQVFCSKHG